MAEYTTKQIADLLDVSKPTVQKVINAKGIEASRIEKNKFRYYSAEQAEVIIREIKEDFDFSILSESTANTEKVCNDTAKVIDKPPTDTEIISRMLDMMKDEMAKKDRELERKDKQIESLQADLKEAYKQIGTLAGQASYITAADKTAQIMDMKQAAAGNEEPIANSEQPQEEQKKKKSIFGFWKK